jgi:hypothetical protein
MIHSNYHMPHCTQRLLTSHESLNTKSSKNWKSNPFIVNIFFSLLLFFIKNNRIFPAKNEIHSICTRHTDNLHPPLLNLTKAQKSVYFSCIKVYNSLPQSTKQLSYDAKKLKVTLKKFPLIHSFYSLEEYFTFDAKFDPDKNWNILSAVSNCN